MTIQQLGGYLLDLSFILGFFKSPPLVALAAFVSQLGAAFESGTGSFSIKVGNAKNIAQYIVDAGFVFSLFKFLAPASAFLETLGADLGLGTGSFGPIRVGSEGVSGSVAGNSDGSDTVTFTIAAWA